MDNGRDDGHDVHALDRPWFLPNIPTLEKQPSPDRGHRMVTGKSTIRKVQRTSRTSTTDGSDPLTNWPSGTGTSELLPLPTYHWRRMPAREPGLQ